VTSSRSARPSLAWPDQPEQGLETEQEHASLHVSAPAASTRAGPFPVRPRLNPRSAPSTMANRCKPNCGDRPSVQTTDRRVVDEEKTDRRGGPSSSSKGKFPPNHFANIQRLNESRTRTPTGIPRFRIRSACDLAHSADSQCFNSTNKDVHPSC